MDPENRPASNHASGQTPTGFSVARIGIYIGLMTIVIVVIALLGGIWLDNTLGTKPLFILILVLGSMPVSIWLTYKLAVRSVKNVKYTGPKTTIRPYNEEDDNGD